MPSASSLTLNDGTNNLSFVPVAVAPEKSLFVDRSPATSAGSRKLILGLSASHPGRSTNKVSVRLDWPTEYTSDGIVLVRDTARAVVDVVLPDAMTSAERVVFWNVFQAAIAHATVAGYVDSLEPVW